MTQETNNKVEVKIYLAQALSEQTGIPVEKCAEFLADEFMRLIGVLK